VRSQRYPPRTTRIYTTIYYYYLLLHVCPILLGVGEAIWRLLVIYYYYLLLHMCVPFCQESAKLFGDYSLSSSNYSDIYYYLLLLFTTTCVSRFVRSRRSYSLFTTTIYYYMCVPFLSGVGEAIWRLLVILLAPLPQQQLQPARNPKALFSWRKKNYFAFFF
jgi:1,4-dihydroxy-2-naphthoate octaprenyltransferase